jgi:hypothetical protein
VFSLFPKSWLRSQGRDAARMAKAADTVMAEWRQSLATALGLVTRVDGLTPEEAPGKLHSLDFVLLLSLDQALRPGFWASFENSAGNPGPLPTPITEISTDITAYLFTAACNRNGFIRERALNAFGHYPDRLAVAAALIRCDDWVPPVQQAATHLLIRLLESPASSSIFDHLPLLLRLKQRKRVAEVIWPQRIVPALRSPAFRELRWKSTRSPDSGTRVFAFQLVFEADPDRVVEAIENACADGHPKVALWGLSTAVLGGSSSEALLKRALEHGSAAVRTYALRTYEELGATDLREVLERALFDVSRGARDAAAYLLNERFGESARQRWRAAIDSRDERRAPIAVIALAYAAEEEDAERLTPFLEHAAARIRAFALRGLVRAKAPRSEEFLARGLRDPSGLVVRVALKLFSKEGPSLDLFTLEHAYASAPSEAVRRRLLHGSRVLGKWETLSFLLPLMSSADAAITSGEINRWLQASNRRFTPLDSAVRVKLAGELRRLQDSAPSPRWAELKGILLHS